MIPVQERYELKFHIPHTMIEPIAAFASCYCDLDRYSHRESDNYYYVNSLYFDTPRFLFLTQREEKVQRRFNMRIRSYGENPALPYFLEIKHKECGIVRKHRGRVTDHGWEDLFTSTATAAQSGESATEKENRSLFITLKTVYGAQPRVLTQYRRIAYVSRYDEYARVTFDRDMCCIQENGLVPHPNGRSLTALDNETVFHPGCDTILELKCYTSHVPFWMIDLIRTFNLERSGFSKYAASIYCLRGSVLHDIHSRRGIAF